MGATRSWGPLVHFGQPWPIGQGNPRGIFVIPGIFLFFLGIVSNLFPKLFKPSNSLIHIIPLIFISPKRNSLSNPSSPNSIEGELEACLRRFNRWNLNFLPSKVAKVCGIHLWELVSPKEPFNFSQISLLLFEIMTQFCPNFSLI